MSDSETINLDEITDESFLQSLLDQTEDIDDRKAIRTRIQELRSAQKAKRNEKLDRLTNTREEMLKKKQKEAEEQKKRTLAMYDHMAKSAPAGGDKKLDIGVYKSFDGTPPSSGSATPTGFGKKDLVEETLRMRQKEADERKKRILAAYDAAAKSGPAGAPKDIDFSAFKRADVSDYELPKPVGACTFGMSGGIPKVVKAPSSQPTTPKTPNFPSGPNFPDPDAHLDPMERAIRARQREAEERKRRVLAAYDIVAKQGTGPKTVVLEEFRDLNESKVSARANFEQLDSASGNVKPVQANFRGGGVNRNPADIKDMLLRWCKAKTRGYEHVEINNFSSNWANGMAFCALMHHFYPDEFDYESLDPKNRRKNLEIAFRVAEEKADITPLLEVDDMIMMKDKPDWKCIFTYIQSIYRKLHAVD